MGIMPRPDIISLVGEKKLKKKENRGRAGRAETSRAIQAHSSPALATHMEKKSAKMREDGNGRPKQVGKSVEEIFLKLDGRHKFKSKNPAFNIDPNVKGAPVDYSFRKIFFLSELERRTPREYRVGIPKKAASGKYISSSLWANYNHLTNLNDVNSLVKVSFNRPEMIAWLDVSFNEIQIVSSEILELKNLKILYLHGNQIKYFIEVAKLKALKKLRTLTLHGNPIEENYNYRALVVKHLPQLVNLDFSLVTRD